MKIKQQDPSKVIIIPRPPQSMASDTNAKEVNGEVISGEEAEEELPAPTGHKKASAETSTEDRESATKE